MPLFDRPPIDAISASNSLFSSGTFRVTGGPGVTVGSDASGASVSGQAFSLAASNSTWTSGSFRLSGGSGATVRSDASGGLIDAGLKFGAWENYAPTDVATFTTASAVTKTPFYYPLPVPGPMTLNSVRFMMSMSAFTGTALSATIHWGLYTKVNSTSANLLASVSDTFLVSSASSASASGLRQFILTSPSTLAGMSNITGGDYVAGFMISASAAGAIQGSLLAPVGGIGGMVGAVWPGVNSYSTGSTQNRELFGRGSTTVAAMPANVVAADLWNQAGGASAGFYPWTHLNS